MAFAFLLSGLLLLGSAKAQSTNNNDTYTYLDVTFSSPGARDCGQGTTGEGNAVTFSVTNPSTGTIPTCFNLNSTFTRPNVTYSTQGYACQYDQPCGVNYTISGAEHFNNAANYSQIWYKQNSYPVQSTDDDENEENRVGRLRFITYPGLDCSQIAGEDGELDAYFTWNCNEQDGVCGTVPYDVRSFSILSIDEDDQGDGDCVVDVEYSAAVRPGVAGSWIALAMAFTFIAFVV